MRPPLALITAALSVLALASPASAQTGPGPEGCSDVASSVSREPVPRGSSSDVQAATNPVRWTPSRLSPASGSPTQRGTALGDDACAGASSEPTRSVASASPGPTPTAVDEPCPTFTLSTAPALSGAERTITATPDSTREDLAYRLRLYRTDPAPQAVVRDVAATGTAPTMFRVRLGESHRFRLEAFTTEEFCLPASTTEVLAPVTAAVTIAARRNGTRDYAFTGRVQPAYGTVALYRLEASGRRVLTATAPVEADGTYRIDRRFLGSGRFGFVTVADPGSTGRYSVGSTSAVRPTVLH